LAAGATSSPCTGRQNRHNSIAEMSRSFRRHPVGDGGSSSSGERVPGSVGTCLFLTGHILLYTMKVQKTTETCSKSGEAVWLSVDPDRRGCPSVGMPHPHRSVHAYPMRVLRKSDVVRSIWRWSRIVSSLVQRIAGGGRWPCGMGAASVPSTDGRASRWPSCEWNRPAFGPQAAFGWRLIRRPASLPYVYI